MACNRIFNIRNPGVKMYHYYAAKIQKSCRMGFACTRLVMK